MPKRQRDSESETDQPSKSWVFTHNNFTESDKQRYLDLDKTYLCLGEEIGESGTPHLQGFITFQRAYRLTQLKKIIPTAHWEPALVSDGMNYCMKENYTIQDNRKKGKRNDLDHVRQMVSENKPMSQIVLECTSYQSIRMAEKLKEYRPERRKWPVNVSWFHGPAGSNKSRTAWELMPDAYSKPPGKYWCGYDGDYDVIIEDIRPPDISFHELLRVLDRYPHIVEVKGGHRQLLIKNIILTSPYPPEQLYCDNGEDIQQLLRRITTIKYFPPVPQ